MFQDSRLTLRKYHKCGIMIGALFTGVIFTLFGAAAFIVSDDLFVKITMSVIAFTGIVYPISIYQMINGKGTNKE